MPSPYPLTGTTLENTLSLPIKFQPYSGLAAVAGWSSNYRIDMVNGWFVVAIPAGQTTWGGAPIDSADMLPVLASGWDTSALSFASTPSLAYVG